MADSKVSIIPLDGKNYVTWKLQCKMALMSHNLWCIVNGTETVPTGDEATPASIQKFNLRRDKALSILVLAISPSLLYLIGDPEDPVEVWIKLESHFQRNSWVNQFLLRKKLYNLNLENNGNLEDHIRILIQLFDNLCAVGDELKEKDRVMILLSSLPTRFDVLVTALQSSIDLPSWERVVEQLSNQDARQSEEIVKMCYLQRSLIRILGIYLINTQTQVIM